MGRRGELTRRICILAGVMLLVSLVAIVVGAVSVTRAPSESDFPFSAGAAMVAGIPAFLLSFCGMYMFYEGKKSSEDDTSGCFDCCKLTMVIWFAITILAICFGFGLGIVACSNETERVKVCLNSADARNALSILTIIITSVLSILTLAIFFTCCCNAATFGMHTYSYGSNDNRPSNIILYSRRDNLHESAPFEARSQPPRPRSSVQNISYDNDTFDRNTREPYAPHLSDTRQYSFENIYPGSISFEPYASGRGASSNPDPPPSYEESALSEARS